MDKDEYDECVDDTSFMDNEYDARNIETFGENYEEFHWQETHSSRDLFEQGKAIGYWQESKVVQEQPSMVSYYSQENPVDYDYPKNDEGEDYLFDVERDMEKQISKLLEDSSDEDEGNFSNNYGKKSVTCNSKVEANEKPEPMLKDNSQSQAAVWNMHPTTIISQQSEPSSTFFESMSQLRHESYFQPHKNNKNDQVKQTLLQEIKSVQNQQTLKPPPVFKTLEEVEQEQFASSDSAKSLIQKSTLNPQKYPSLKNDSKIWDLPIPLFPNARSFPILNRPRPLLPNINREQLRRGDHYGFRQFPPYQFHSLQFQHAEYRALQMRQRIRSFSNQGHFQVPIYIPPPPQRYFPHFPRPISHYSQIHGPLGDKNPFLKSSNVDIYQGFMTEDEKQNLKKIQMIQLLQDHSPETDFYYLMHKLKIETKTDKELVEGQIKYLLKLYPNRSVDNISNNHNYLPVQYENTLGKLQAINSVTPRKVLGDQIRLDCSMATNQGKRPKPYRLLLLEIEKYYEYLMIINSAQIRKNILNNLDEETEKLEAEYTEKVLCMLKSKEKFSEIMGVRKGQKLISRFIALLDL